MPWTWVDFSSELVRVLIPVITVLTVQVLTIQHQSHPFYCRNIIWWAHNFPSSKRTKAEYISADRQRRKRNAMMIDSTTEVTHPQNFICPISFDLMTDPLVSIYGHHYQKEAILGWLNQGNSTCPLTREPLTMAMLVSDGHLQSNIERWMLQNGLTVQPRNEYEDPETMRVVGLGCSIFAPSEQQLRKHRSWRRPFRFLCRRP